MWLVILALFILGVTLMVVEGFLPGLVIGIVGAIAVLAATVLAFIHYGAAVGSILMLFVIACGSAFTVWWIRYAPRSKFAKKWTLHTTVDASSPMPDPEALLGTVGEAISPLRPAGIAEIGGRRIDVVTEGDMISSGARVRVIKVEGNRIVVRALEEHPELSA